VTFSESRDRHENGMIVYPRDVSLRRELLFIEESFQHPAKMNLHLLNDIIEHTSKPGDTVMDITAGSGSLLMACAMGRKVVCIDLNPTFIEWMHRSAEAMSIPDNLRIILHGDCRDFLPLPAQSIIFSPPYSDVLKGSGGIMSREIVGEQMGRYQEDPRNLGNLTEFMFNRAMDAIYKKCWDSLPPGGTLTLIIKDTLKGGKLNPLGWNHVQMMYKAGWELQEWHIWDPPGTQFKAIHRAKGHRTVEGEHIIIMRRPV